MQFRGMDSNYHFRLSTEAAEILPCYELIVQLQPGLTEEQFRERIPDMLDRGYRLLILRYGTALAGVCGIWTGTKLYSGKYLELDNVVVDKGFRNRGAGNLICREVIRIAQEEGIEMLMLDAYRENEAAHRFYERMGFTARGYHFLMKV